MSFMIRSIKRPNNGKELTDEERLLSVPPLPPVPPPPPDKK
jgi:hypothetical protein